MEHFYVFKLFTGSRNCKSILNYFHIYSKILENTTLVRSQMLIFHLYLNSPCGCLNSKLISSSPYKEFR